MSRRLEIILSAYPTHLSVSDLATVLGVTMKTTYEYLQAGDIPAYRVVRKWVILRDDVRDFLERSSVYRPGLGEISAANQQAARTLAGEPTRGALNRLPILGRPAARQ